MHAVRKQVSSELGVERIIRSDPDRIGRAVPTACGWERRLGLQDCRAVLRLCGGCNQTNGGVTRPRLQALFRLGPQYVNYLINHWKLCGFFVRPNAVRHRRKERA